MPSPIQAQWSLSSTTSNTLSIAKGMIAASTSDNVQIWALLACEAFGNTLAISPSSCDRVERQVLPTPEPASIEFLKALVGYSKNDCATMLGQSQAGLQFLGLATVLVTTSDLGDCAGYIHLMLERSRSSQEELLPTRRHILDLLASLEARCHRAGFLNDVFQWETNINSWTADAGVNLRSIVATNYRPDPESMEKMIDVFRQLRRVGKPTLSRALLRTSKCTAWTAAVVEWCLGCPPSVFLDDGTCLHRQPGSAVSIVDLTHGQVEGHFDITIVDELSGPEQLVALSRVSRESSTGMLSLSNYAKWLLQNLGLTQDEITERALAQILPHAVQQVHDNLIYESNGTKEKGSKPHDFERDHRLYPYSSRSTIANTMGYFHPDGVKTLKRLGDGLLISDLPLFDEAFKKSGAGCPCFGCRGGGIISFKTCQRNEFADGIVLVVADILALSLFFHPEEVGIRVPYVLPSMRRASGLRGAISDILRDGSPCKVSITDLLTWAVSLAGHKVTDEIDNGQWFMSCDSGQAIWPTIYDAPMISEYGFMALACVPGKLTFKGDHYSRVNARLKKPSIQGGPYYGPKETEGIASLDVLGPRNVYPNLKMHWNVEVGKENLLACMAVDGEGILYEANPFIFNQAANTTFVEGCHHDRGAKLTKIDKFSQYTTFHRVVADRSAYEEGGTDRVKIVAVDSDDALRIFALALMRNKDATRIVLRKSACLACSLQACRLSNIDVLVL